YFISVSAFPPLPSFSTCLSSVLRLLAAGVHPGGGLVADEAAADRHTGRGDVIEVRVGAGHRHLLRPLVHPDHGRWLAVRVAAPEDRKSTRLNCSNEWISYAVFSV